MSDITLGLGSDKLITQGAGGAIDNPTQGDGNAPDTTDVFGGGFVGPGQHPGFEEEGGSAPSSGLTVKTHIVYLLEWAGPGTELPLNTDGPQRWLITRADGSTVEVPISGTVTILKPDGSTASANPEPESDAPDEAMGVGIVYLMDQRGTWRFTLNLILPDGRRIGASQKVYVD